MEKRTSAIARILAALALVGAVVAIIVVVSGSVGEDSSPKSSTAKRQTTTATREETKPKPKAKTYVIKSGDTLEGISEKTGVSVQKLLALNPQVDPQILDVGETLKLR